MKDKEIHNKGLISVHKQIHDDLDAAALEAYGSAGVPPASSSSQSGQDTRAPVADLLARGGADAEALEQQILTRLVALNHERAAEEKRGLIRWLRTDYQAPTSSDGHRPPLQTEIEGVDTSEHSASNIQNSTFQDWPTDLPAQVAALRKLLSIVGQDPGALTACFGRKSQKRTTQITAILDTLKALGHIA